MRLTNLNYEGVVVPIAEIELKLVWVDSNNKATTNHSVYSITQKVVDGEETEVKKFLKDYNHEFTYQGGNILQEALVSLQNELLDPNT